jgi:Flp pilus assembly protein TadD
LAALDHWAGAKDALCPGTGEPLLAVARLADDDTWRNQLRDPQVRQDRPTLERMAGEDGVLDQPPANLVSLGRPLADAKAGTAAVSLLRAVQQRHPADFWINFQLASLLPRQPAMNGKRVGFYRVALALRPSSAVVYNNLGSALHEEEKHADAEAASRKAIELKPDYAEPYHNLGVDLHAQGKLAEAVNAYRKAVRIKPDYANCYFSLGISLVAMGKQAEAVAAYQKAIELQPAFPQAHNNLGIALRDLGRLADAVKEYHKSIELKPDHAQASTYLGGSTGITGAFLAGAVAVNQEKGPGIAVDASGNAYVAGFTDSATFPTTPGAFQTTIKLVPGLTVGYSGFVTKLNAAGTGLIYSTYLGGSGVNTNDRNGADAIAVDSAGNAYVSGWTNSTDFPTKNPVQAKYAGTYPATNAFVTTLNSSGSGLLFSTYLGGSGYDFGFGLALDSSNNIYVAGMSDADAVKANFPTTAGAYQTAASYSFVSKFSAVVGPSFTITGPTGLTAGTAGTFTLRAVLPGNLTITGGTSSFNVALETAGTQSITATDVNNPSMIGFDTIVAVSPTAASQIVFTQEPASGTAGQILGTVQVTLEDAFGNVETGDNRDKVTLSVNSGPSTQMGGTVTATVSAGNATFNNLVLDTFGSYTLAALANLTGGGTLGPAASTSFSVASPVSIGLGSLTYSSKTGLYSETVTLTNTTGAALTGPLSLELTGLPSGVLLTNATGTTNGNPYIDFLASGKTLKKGASVSITLTFSDPSQISILFGTEVLVGM